jgi:hypothetical protein
VGALALPAEEAEDLGRPAVGAAEPVRQPGAEYPALFVQVEPGAALVPPVPVPGSLCLGSGELLTVLDRRAPKTRVLALEPDAAV